MAVEPADMVPIEEITPSVLDVAELLRARTKNSSGFEVGTFNDDTRPTSAQVAGLAEQAATHIQVRLGTSAPVEVIGDAKGCAALLAACMVELSFFPEQVESGRSPYDQLRALLDMRLNVLASWVGGGDGVPPGELEVRSLRIPVLGEEYIDEDGVARPIVPVEPAPLEL
jgi:hypothetical protein